MDPFSLNDRDKIAEILAEIARKAGRELMRFFKKECALSHKADQSPVSEADIASQTLIREALIQAFPHIPIISEENAANHHTNPSCFFLVDPLDGTQAFLDGILEFAVLIALIVEKKPVVGVIDVPAWGQTWWAGTSVFRADTANFQQKIRLAPPAQIQLHDKRAVVSASSNADVNYTFCTSKGLTDIRKINSAFKFTMLVEGQADIYPRIGRTMQWDIAAGHALLRALGGGVYKADGQEVTYGLGLHPRQEDPRQENPHQESPKVDWSSPNFLAILYQPAPADLMGLAPPI